MIAGNLFADLPEQAAEELFREMARGGAFRLLRIVSTGQTTPPGTWYDQAEDEWVVLLRGAAGVLIEGEESARVLAPGDWLHLLARCRHRVAWTATDQPTVWLALHYQAEAAPSPAIDPALSKPR